MPSERTTNSCGTFRGPEEISRNDAWAHCSHGRKTFESIGKPLPKRKNVVLSRNTNWLHPEVLVFNDLEKAIAACAEETLMILGGAEIYSQSIPLADRLELTHVHSHFEGDAFFPAIDNNIWEAEHGERKTDAASGISYTFSKWLKKQP